LRVRDFVGLTEKFEYLVEVRSLLIDLRVQLSNFFGNRDYSLLECLFLFVLFNNDPGHSLDNFVHFANFFLDEAVIINNFHVFIFVLSFQELNSVFTKNA